MIERNCLESAVQVIGPSVIAALKLVSLAVVEGDDRGGPSCLNRFSASNSQATACLPSGRSSTYRPVQISGAGSDHGTAMGALVMQHANGAGRVTHHDNSLATDLGAEVIPLVLDLALVTDINPSDHDRQRNWRNAYSLRGFTVRSIPTPTFSSWSSTAFSGRSHWRLSALLDGRLVRPDTFGKTVTHQALIRARYCRRPVLQRRRRRPQASIRSEDPRTKAVWSSETQFSRKFVDALL
jgi:hypothetical protein